jgi:hypothetical protein
MRGMFFLEYFTWNKTSHNTEVRFGEFDANADGRGYACVMGWYAVAVDEDIVYSLTQMYSTKIDGTPFETIEVIGNIHENPELI